MSVFYVDTSALIKRYLSESGSEWIKSLCDPTTGNVIVICDLTIVEFTSTVARREREGTLSRANALVLTERFLADFKRNYLSVSLESKVILAASDKVITSSFPLRSLDAIQLACAFEAKFMLDEPILFISADKRLLEAALGHGFATDNPNDHP